MDENKGSKKHKVWEKKKDSLSLWEKKKDSLSLWERVRVRVGVNEA